MTSSYDLLALNVCVCVRGSVQKHFCWFRIILRNVVTWTEQRKNESQGEWKWKWNEMTKCTFALILYNLFSCEWQIVKNSFARNAGEIRKNGQRKMVITTD